MQRQFLQIRMSVSSWVSQPAQKNYTAMRELLAFLLIHWLNYIAWSMQTPAKSKRLRWQRRGRASFCKALPVLAKARRLRTSSQNALVMVKKCCSFLKSWQPWMWSTTSWSKLDSLNFAYSSTVIKQIKRMLLRIFAIHSARRKELFPRKRTLKLLSRKRHSISWMPMRLSFTSCARSLKKVCISCMSLTPHFGPRQMLSFLSLSLLPKANRTW